jgi:hypothetical protein
MTAEKSLLQIVALEHAVRTVACKKVAGSNHLIMRTAPSTRGATSCRRRSCRRIRWWGRMPCWPAASEPMPLPCHTAWSVFHCVCLRDGNKSSAVLRGTHCHLHVGPVPHVSESSSSAVLQRRLIPSWLSRCVLAARQQRGGSGQCRRAGGCGGVSVAKIWW